MRMINKLTLFFLTGLLSMACTKYDETIGTKILQRNVTLSTQADVDSFMDAHQDGREVAIDGTLLIGNNPKGGVGSDITSLEKLEKLSRVKNLIISMNHQLLSLKGLDKIREVKGTLRIQNNGLEDDLQLSSLKRVDSLVVIQNQSLKSLAGLSSLHTAGSVKISFNEQLEDLHGLDNIKSLNNLYIDKNDQLIDLAGLARLKNISGNLYILVNANLSSLSGLDSLEQVGRNMGFYRAPYEGPADYNPLLEHLSLPRLKLIGGDLSLENIFIINTLEFPVLDSIKGSLLISQAKQLESLAGLGALRYLGKDLVVKQSKLTDLSGLENLEIIKGRLLLQENSLMKNLVGLGELESIDTEIRIVLNPELLSLEGLNTLQETDSLNINHNPKLSNLCPLRPTIQAILDSDPENPAELIDLNGNAKGTYTYEQLLAECPE